MRFLPEPKHSHGATTLGAAGKVGIMLVNLGTPDAPTRGAVRRFLAEFLSDPRVIEIPRLAWWPILHGVILNVRPKDAVNRYASVWMPDGSPLLVWSQRQAAALARLLAERGLGVEVELGMRYGNPSIAHAMHQLRERNCDRILAIPLYPQYSASTTATAVDAIAGLMGQFRNQPEVRVIKHFHDDPGYIDALAQRVQAFWQQNGRGQKLLLSFHGLPRRSLELGDPYYCECQKTGRLLTEKLGVSPDFVEITFQSRFGAAQWLLPYTEPTLIELARQGITEVDVFCPGFIVDCLETLEEIAQEGKAAFIKAGGKSLRYIDALNDSDAWIAALADLAERNLLGWPIRPDDTEAARSSREGEAVLQRERALELGADD